MTTTDCGRVPDGTGLSSPTEPSCTVSALTGFDPSRIVRTLNHIIQRCETATEADVSIDQDIEFALQKIGAKSDWYRIYYTSSLDAALKVVPDSHKRWKCGFSDHVPHWCELWPEDGSGYVWGYSDHTRPLAICAAALRAHAIAMEARQGRDGETRLDAKHDSAGPKDIAQNTSEAR